ncbi:uncharacterized protein LOC131858042 [Cryptomeria japonica]|uniref:uncharacterized protein LOC131858042 n=1 Tax=Cryptomeria japonica TaxID=3369 RepID=UPI0027DAAC9E|nr:uncharacterized protein LOC131858042 [Cryptomeria japonica]
MPPFHPSASASASASTSTPPGGTITFGPRVRKSRLDSYFVPRSTPGAQPSLEGMGWNKEVHDAARKQICKFWYFYNIPFIAARSPYWQGMVDSITICGAGFKAPTDAELSGPLLLQMVEDMKVELEDHRQSWSQKGCTIMTDGWTDRRNRTLLNFLVSCRGSTMFLKSIDASSHVKNATYLCEAIEEVIQEVGEENVVQVVIDNAASYVAAGKLLMERHPKIFWSPCAAHCLDLMLEDIGKLEWVKSIVERAKNISKFIYNHALVLSIMRQYTGQKELARPGITKFASNFLTLKSLIKSKAALRRMFVGEEWTSSSYATTTAGIDVVNCIFDEPGFWTPCGETVQVTEPLVVLLRVVDGEKPSMGYIYEGMDRAKEAIRSIYAGDEDKYGPIWEIIDRRWQNQLHRPIHATAYYLNPAFRFRDDFKEDEEVLSGLYTVVQKLCTDGTASSTTLQLDKYNNREGAIFSSSMCIEARTQLQPDRWWQMFGPSTPNLQKIVIHILSQPCSASGCERNWSMFEHIHSKRRNRLSMERLNDLVFVHYNLRHRTRQILDTDSSPITLAEIDPESEWITESTDPIFTEEDHEWVDQADREAEAVAMAKEEDRARSGTGTSRAETMASQSSRTYIRRICRRQTDYSEAEDELEPEP